MLLSAQAICLVLSVLIPVLIISIFNVSLKKSDISIEKRKSFIKKFSIFTFVYFIVISLLTLNGFFYNFDLPPRILFVFNIVFIISIILAFSKTTKVALKNMPKSWPVYLQSFRFPVEIFLWLLHENGTIPIQMSFEGRNFDILIGLSAPIIAYLCFNKRILSEKVALAWNVFGILMVSNIVVISILSLPNKFRYFIEGPANTLPGVFPFSYLPLILVMSAYFLHIISIRQILLKD